MTFLCHRNIIILSVTQNNFKKLFMDDSFIFDLLMGYSDKFYEKLRHEEDDSLDKIKKSRVELEKALTEEQLKLVDNYKFNCDFREEDINIQLNIKLINNAVKLGMVLQRAFDIDLYE